jgi:hypothetical protein
MELPARCMRSGGDSEFLNLYFPSPRMGVRQPCETMRCYLQKEGSNPAKSRRKLGKLTSRILDRRCLSP